MSNHKTYFMAALFVTFISGCAAPKVANFPVNPVEATEALSFTTKPGLAKVYLIGGTMGFGAFTDPEIFGSDLFVNGVNVVKTNRGEAAVLDIAPGTYTFTFQPRGDDSSNQIPLVRMVSSGEVVIFRADIKMPKAALLVGLLAGSARAELTEIFDRGAIRGKTFIAAAGCPDSICPKTLSYSTPTPIPTTVHTPAKPTIESAPSALQRAENKCKELGFTAGTEKYGDCVLRLSTLP